MRKIVDRIKDQANSDYRLHMSGVVCDIYDANQIIGMSAVLTVAPVGYNDPQNINPESKRFNVIPAGNPSVYGFPTNLKEAYYAYVITDDVSKIEGKVAVIIPKNILLSNPGPDWNTSNNMISPSGINDMVVRKDDLIVSRKYS